MAPNDDNVTIVLAVDRVRGLIRGVLWCLPAVLVGFASGLLWSRVDFRVSGVSNGVVAACLAVIAGVFTLVAVGLALLAVRWLLLAVWPGRLGMFASEEMLVLRLGPFGIHDFDVAELRVQYPYEIEEDVEDGVFEALLAPEEQRCRFVPRITHPRQQEPLQRMILRFSRTNEAELVGMLAPIVARWRARQGAEAES